MSLAESKEAYGKSQIPEGHPNLSCGAPHVRGGGPVRFPLLDARKACHTRKAVEDSEKEVQPSNRRPRGYIEEYYGGDTVERHLDTIIDTNKGGAPHSRVDEAGSVGERRGQQKRIYQLHTREKEHVF